MHLGHVPAARTGCRTRRPSRLPAGVEGLVFSARARGRLYYADLSGGRSAGSPPTTPRRPRIAATPDLRHGPLTVAFNGTCRAIPRATAHLRMGPRRRRRLRRLYGRRADPHLHGGRRRHRAAARQDPGGPQLLPRRRPSRSAGCRCSTIAAPPRRHVVRRRQISFAGRAQHAGGAPGAALLVDEPSPLPTRRRERLPRACDPGRRRRRDGDLHRSRPRVPVAPAARAHRDRRRRPEHDRADADEPPTRTSRWPPSRPACSSRSRANRSATPFTRTVIARSVTSVSAPSPQVLGVAGYLWGAWSDGLGQTHAVTASGLGVDHLHRDLRRHRGQPRRPRRHGPRRPARVQRPARHRRGLPRDRRPDRCRALRPALPRPDERGERARAGAPTARAKGRSRPRCWPRVATPTRWRAAGTRSSSRAASRSSRAGRTGSAC